MCQRGNDVEYKKKDGYGLDELNRDKLFEHHAVKPGKADKPNPHINMQHRKVIQVVEPECKAGELDDAG